MLYLVAASMPTLEQSKMASMEIDKPPEEEKEETKEPKKEEVIRNVGEVILAYHLGLLYEAKILETKSVTDSEGGSTTVYRVHFEGWRKSWDAEVPADKVLEHSDENLRLAHDLLQRVQKRAAPNSDSKDEDGKKKNGKDSGKEGDDDPANASIESLFVIPAPLKRQLVDDWEFVTKEHKLVELPQQNCAENILEAWLQAKMKSRAGCDRASKEVAQGLQEYFDAALPVFLLYRFERPQYDTLFNQGGKGTSQRPSHTYGAEHLLRLMVKLPSMLEASGLERPVIKQIAEKVNEFMRFLQKNGRDCFVGEYKNADDAYIAGAQQEA